MWKIGGGDAPLAVKNQEVSSGVPGSLRVDHAPTWLSTWLGAKSRMNVGLGLATGSPEHDMRRTGFDDHPYPCGQFDTTQFETR